MAKPAAVPTFATDTNYPASSQPWGSTPTKVQPASGKLAMGHEPEEPPPAQHVNWWQNLVGQWTAWLNGLFDGSGNLTLDANASVIVSGTGSHKRGEKTRHIGPNNATQVSGSMSRGTTHGEWLITTAGQILHFELPTEEGERIKSVSCRVFENDSLVISLAVYRVDTTGTSASRTQLGSTASSSSSANLQTLTVSGLTETVGATSLHYVAEITCTGSGNGGIHGSLMITDIP